MYISPSVSIFSHHLSKHHTLLDFSLKIIDGLKKHLSSIKYHLVAIPSYIFTGQGQGYVTNGNDYKQLKTHKTRVLKFPQMTTLIFSKAFKMVYDRQFKRGL